MLHRKKEIVPYRGTSGVIFKRRKKEKEKKKEGKKREKKTGVGGSFSQHPLPLFHLNTVDPAV